MPSLKIFSYFAFRFSKEIIISKDTRRTFSTHQSFPGLYASFLKHGIKTLHFAWNSLAVIFNRIDYSKDRRDSKISNHLEWTMYFRAILNIKNFPLFLFFLLENKILYVKPL